MQGSAKGVGPFQLSSCFPDDASQSTVDIYAMREIFIHNILPSAIQNFSDPVEETHDPPAQLAR